MDARTAGALGGRPGAQKRWGDYDARREKARELRAAGKTLKQIAAECGYQSIAAAHYACAGKEE